MFDGKLVWNGRGERSSDAAAALAVPWRLFALLLAAAAIWLAAALMYPEIGNLVADQY